MREEGFGTRDRSGSWTPLKPLTYPAVFVLPPQFGAIWRWFWGEYVLSFNLVYAGIGVLIWLFATPSFEVMQTLAPGWIFFILARNAALTAAWFGLWHGWLYVKRAQGTEFKYNPKWPKEQKIFFGGSQLRENLALTFLSGVPIWTVFEVGMLWAFANGWLWSTIWADDPIYLALIFLAIPLWGDVHFYGVHRLIHWPPLYRRFHAVHHKNVNPTPWSGLAMHPGEHLLYFSGVLIHFIVPATPLHVAYQLVQTGLAPAPGHAGFDRVVTGDDRAIETHSFAHYLHHKYFECNYADGAIPLDRWFGSFCDGSPESIRAMKKRQR